MCTRRPGLVARVRHLCWFVELAALSYAGGRVRLYAGGRIVCIIVCWRGRIVSYRIVGRIVSYRGARAGGAAGDPAVGRDWEARRVR